MAIDALIPTGHATKYVNLVHAKKRDNSKAKTREHLIKSSQESKRLVGNKKDFLKLRKKATERELFDKKKKS